MEVTTGGHQPHTRHPKFGVHAFRSTGCFCLDRHIADKLLLAAPARQLHVLCECADMSNRHETLRVGVILDSTGLVAWQGSLLDSLQRADNIHLALVIEDRSSSKGRRAINRVIERVVSRLAQRSASIAHDACASVPIPEYFQGVASVRLQSICKSQDHCRSLLSEHRIDLLISLSDDPSIPQLGAFIRLGVWRLEVNGKAFQPRDGSLVGAFEVMLRKPVLTTTFRMLGTDNTTSRIAYETHSPVDVFSHAVSRNEHLWKCSLIPARVLKACTRVGSSDYVAALQSTLTTSLGRRSECTLLPPLIAYFAYCASYVVWRAWRKFARRVCDEKWTLVACHGNDPSELRVSEIASPPVDRFWADPHVVSNGDGQVVFFEDASLDTGHGRIAVADVSDNGHITRPRTILSRPYHLSYPFVFSWEGAHYLVPESADNRTVELYLCRSFPDEWEFSHNLMENISAYDATLFPREGKWWLFANVRALDGASTWDELHLFWAANPLSTDWSAHPLNPVISDVRRARPAGPVFERDGRLFRPSQDSSVRYGRALNVSEILELSPTQYREVLIHTLEPTFFPGMKAVHTFSGSRRVSFIDAIVCKRSARRRITST